MSFFMCGVGDNGGTVASTQPPQEIPLPGKEKIRELVHSKNAPIGFVNKAVVTWHSSRSLLQYGSTYIWFPELPVKITCHSGKLLRRADLLTCDSG